MLKHKKSIKDSATEFTNSISHFTMYYELNELNYKIVVLGIKQRTDVIQLYANYKPTKKDKQTLKELYKVELPKIVPPADSNNQNKKKKVADKSF